MGSALFDAQDESTDSHRNLNLTHDISQMPYAQTYGYLLWCLLEIS